VTSDKICPRRFKIEKGDTLEPEWYAELLMLIYGYDFCIVLLQASRLSATVEQWLILMTMAPCPLCHTIRDGRLFCEHPPSYCSPSLAMLTICGFIDGTTMR
jgi:hypothetical protein